jgi:ROS/MUCR transcriptional regulator protein
MGGSIHDRWKIPPPFQTRHEIELYYSGDAILCLLCGQLFQRLAFHLAAKHDVTSAEYKGRFGLPWTRGLTSAASNAQSGWTDKRRAAASKAARRSRFFELAHREEHRRELAPYLKRYMAQNLGERAVGFGAKFERRVRTLFDKGRNDREIARALDVNRTTVNRITKYWRNTPRKNKNKKKRK